MRRFLKVWFIFLKKQLETFSSSVVVWVQTSDGGAECFRDLKVGVFKEIVPMGVDPEVVSYQLAGLMPQNTSQIILRLYWNYSQIILSLFPDYSQIILRLFIDSQIML